MHRQTNCAGCVVLLFWLVACTGLVPCMHLPHRMHERVSVTLEEVRVSDNPLETYEISTIPGCITERAVKAAGLLTRDQAVDKQRVDYVFLILFGQNLTDATACTITSGPKLIEAWRQFVQKNFAYVVRVDGWSVEAPLGTVVSVDDKVVPQVYTHYAFHIKANAARQVTGVRIVPGRPQPLAPFREYAFLYTVYFNLNMPDEDAGTRFDGGVYFLPHMSRTRLINLVVGFFIATLLVAAVLLITARTARIDYAKSDDLWLPRFEGGDIIDDGGWRQLHNDVYRVPSHTGLFCAMLGAGMQLTVLATAVVVALFLDVAADLRARRAMQLIVLLYALTSAFAGYVAGRQFIQASAQAPILARSWTACLGQTIFLTPVLLFTTLFTTNIMALFYNTTQLISMGDVLMLVAAWILICCPCTIIGTLVGRFSFRRTEQVRDVKRVNQIPRLIPVPRHRLTSPRALLLLSGLLPFITMYAELDATMRTIWRGEEYTVHGMLPLVFIFYLTSTACVAVIGTFVLLITENHRWKWSAFGFGASSAFYTALYAICFYWMRATMHGLYMFTYYYAYMLCFTAAAACAGGSVAYFASSAFVSILYSRVKND